MEIGDQIDPRQQVTITVRRSQLDNVFALLGECGLGELSEGRRTFLRESDACLSPGAFWTNIQRMQQQYTEQTGESPPTNLLSLRDRERRYRF